jgi:hypothetical protein
MVLPLTTSTALIGVSQEETVVENPSRDILEKIVGAPPTKRCKKTTHSAFVSLEAHQPISSSDNVSITFCMLIFCFALQPLMQRFLSLGSDCVKIQKGIQRYLPLLPLLSCYILILTSCCLNLLYQVLIFSCSSRCSCSRGFFRSQAENHF